MREKVIDEEQRKDHDEALDFYRQNLCPGDTAHSDPFPEKED